MRLILRYFFRAVRLLLGPVVLLWEALSTPRGVQRDPAVQAELDRRTAGLALYQFRTCPFCIKTRRRIAALSLNIERRDAQHDAQHRAELAAGGGEVKVPCLRIEEDAGEVRWLYESDAIIDYLERLAGSVPAALPAGRSG